MPNKREIIKNDKQANQEKYCLARKQYVKVSAHNKNGDCACLNCSEQECRGVLCDEQMANKCTNMIDYLKGENPLCVECIKQR
jgi:hypothetical protein